MDACLMSSFELRAKDAFGRAAVAASQYPMLYLPKYVDQPLEPLQTHQLEILKITVNCSRT